jgi:TRAP-type C4-dicarboxylate transport system permease small subunit
MLQGTVQPEKSKSPAERAFWFLILKIPEILLAILIGILVLFLTVSVFARYALDIGLSW